MKPVNWIVVMCEGLKCFVPVYERNIIQTKHKIKFPWKKLIEILIFLGTWFFVSGALYPLYWSLTRN